MVEGIAEETEGRWRADGSFGEDHLRAVFEALPAAAASVDLGGGIICANRALARVLGYDDAEELVGASLPALIRTGDRRSIPELLASSGAVEGISKNGAPVRLQISGSRFRVAETDYFAIQLQAVSSPSPCEERNRLLFERSLAGVYRTSGGRITELNEAAARILGFESAEEAIGVSTADFYFDPGEREHFYERLKRTGHLTNEELRLKRRDGNPVWVLENASVVRAGDGEGYSIEGSLIDITERKRFEEALSSSEQQYRLLFENNPQPMWVYDLETLRFLAVNDAAVQRYGYSREEFLSMRLTDIRPEEDVPRLIQSASQPTAGLASTGRWRHRRKDGTILDVEVWTHEIRFEGKVARLVLANDITERVRVERELAHERNLLRTLIDLLPDSVYVKDTKSRFMMNNRAHLRVVSGPSEQEVVGKTDFDCFPRELAAGYYADEVAVLKSGEPLLNKEELVIWRSGERRWFLTSQIPLRDSQGSIIGLVGVGRDITEQKEVEDRLKRFAARLELSNRELQDFAFIASHHLQEPLRKIQAFGNRLRSKCGDSLSSEALSWVERMEEAARRMQRLVGDLFVFSRIITTAAPFEEVDLSAVVAEVLADLAAEIKQSGARLQIDPLPTLEAERSQMRLLLYNLISNALKFRREQEAPVVKVSAGVYGAPWNSHHYCELLVEDNGIGFDEKHRERVFGVFQRLHGPDRYDGTGIGLAMCRKIVDHHNGAITAISTPGRGSTFIVRLPVEQGRVEGEK